MKKPSPIPFTPRGSVAGQMFPSSKGGKTASALPTAEDGTDRLPKTYAQTRDFGDRFSGLTLPGFLGGLVSSQKGTFSGDDGSPKATGGLDQLLFATAELPITQPATKSPRNCSPFLVVDEHSLHRVRRVGEYPHHPRTVSLGILGSTRKCSTVPSLHSRKRPVNVSPAEKSRT